MQEQGYFLSALRGEKTERVPFWLMRQAGRYLPEYRDLRAKAGGFLSMVYNPDFAIEVTLQPIRRFRMDAAILFSDILVIPHALGQHLEFTQGEGPKLDPLRDLESVGRLSFNEKILQPVYDSVSGIREKLFQEGFHETALIGFAGAPWTVATYMVEGGSSREMIHVKHWAYERPEEFQVLIDAVTEATIRYLLRQIESGAQAIQIFESWAGVLDEEQFRRWVIAPTKKIVSALREKYPSIPVIGFPRGAGMLYPFYAAETGVNAVSLDPQVSFESARALQKEKTIQGNLDPVCLLTGGKALEDAARKILSELSGGPFIFNLGHGVIKETPPEHVQALAAVIKGWRA